MKENSFLLNYLNITVNIKFIQWLFFFYIHIYFDHCVNAASAVNGLAESYNGHPITQFFLLLMH